MSILNFSNLLSLSPAAPATVIITNPPVQLTYGIFYTAGPTFAGNFGKFVTT